jgi:curved DNA-binding protein CbpA
MTKPYSDPYATLDLPHTATAAEIKQAYFTLVRSYPPERDPQMFKRIRAAYERLRDPEQRAETDMQRLQEWPTPARRRRTPQLDLSLQRADVIAAARALTDLVRSDWREHYEKVKL